MSARAAIDRDRTGAIWPPVVVLAALAILVARPFVSGSPGTRVALFGAGYATIAVAAVTLRVADPSTRPLRARMVLALGVLAVGAAVLATGAPVPRPSGTATLPLAVLAAVAEEALFRRAAYGWLARFGAPVAIVVSAALFAVVHLPAYGTTALPVDLGAGLLLSWQRWASGTWTVPAATHVLANVIAVAR